MALTRTQLREWLSEAGIADEKIGSTVDRIIAGHSSTVDALKEESAKYKSDADKVAELTSQLNAANQKITDGESWKAKFEGLQKKQERSAKRNAFEKAFREAKANESAISLFADTADFDALEIDENGTIKDIDSVLKPYKERYSDFFAVESVDKTKQPNPPKGEKGAELDLLNDADYYAAVMKKGT